MVKYNTTVAARASGAQPRAIELPCPSRTPEAPRRGQPWNSPELIGSRPTSHSSTLAKAKAREHSPAIARRHPGGSRVRQSTAKSPARFAPGKRRLTPNATKARARASSFIIFLQKLRPRMNPRSGYRGPALVRISPREQNGCRDGLRVAVFQRDGRTSEALRRRS